MSKVRHLLSSGSFSQDWSNAALITVNNDWSGVASIMGYRGDDIITATGVDPRTILAAASSEVVTNVIANQVNPNTVSTGGVIEFDAIANRTIALNGSGTADAPSIVVYLDATGRENVRFQANIRDIDGSADNAIQQVAVQWRVGGGNWENIFYIADATDANAATKVTAVDVTLPSGANNAADLEVRVITTNAAGNDEAVGIDDIVVSSMPAAADETPPTLAAFNPTDPDDGAVAVEAGANIVLRFSEAVKAGTGGFTLSNGTDNRFIAITNPQVTISGNTVTIDPATDLAAGTTYMLTAPAGVIEDLAGNDFAGLGEGVLDFTIADPLQTITIGEVQGLGHRSAYVNTKVRTEGVVTAVDSNGFYIQSASGASDGDIRTSDGIFVFTGVAPGVTKGELLRIDATVSEFRPGNDTRNLTITQLTTPTIAKLGMAAFEPVVIGDGYLLPPTAVIDDDGLTSYDPATDGIDFWESLEGMYITVDKPIAVSNTNNFGETYVVASGGAGATGMSAAGGITLSEGDYNPERLQLDQDTGLFGGFNNELSIGDRISDVKGVISYAFQSYELLVTEAVTVTKDVTLEREYTNLLEADDKLSVADYNLENLSAVDSMDKFYSLASDIVYNLNAPDILAVQEIQDADGAGTGSDLSGVPTANMLIQAILDMGGPQYAYVEVAPSAPNSTGGEPNGNIRNGYFYDPSRVSLVEGSVQLINDPVYNGTRRPLAASFEFNGETVTLVNVHSTSRLGSDPLYGSAQPPADAGDGARTAQAQAVRNWIDGTLAVDASAKIAVLGDFNGFTWENAIKALTNGGKMQDLNTLLPEEERYSYMFDGNQQQIDHIIATQNLVQVAEFDNVHLNAQQPDGLQLSTDHDAVIAVFQLGGANSFVAAPDMYDYAATANFAAFRSPDAWHVMLP
jgi:predicted extracellular nuclease